MVFGVAGAVGAGLKPSPPEKAADLNTGGPRYPCCASPLGGVARHTIDSREAPVENLNMRHGFVALLVWLIALAGVRMAVAGQQAAPEPEELGPTFHYVPPSAKESVEIGDFYFRRKKYTGALSRYEEAARDDPDYAPAYFGMGKAYEKMGKKREALASYQKYLDALPSKKQADEAADAQKAVRHLEGELNRQRKSGHSARPTSAGPES